MHAVYQARKLKKIQKLPQEEPLTGILKNDSWTLCKWTPSDVRNSQQLFRVEKRWHDRLSGRNRQSCKP